MLLIFLWLPVILISKPDLTIIYFSILKIISIDIFFSIYSFFNHILLLKTLCLLRWMLPDTMQIERRAERMFKHWSVAWPLHTVYINTWYTCTSCYLLLHSGKADKWILLSVNFSVSGYFTRRYHLYSITSICCMLSTSN